MDHSKLRLNSILRVLNLQRHHEKNTVAASEYLNVPFGLENASLAGQRPPMRIRPRAVTILIHLSVAKREGTQTNLSSEVPQSCAPELSRRRPPRPVRSLDPCWAQKTIGHEDCKPSLCMIYELLGAAFDGPKNDESLVMSSENILIPVKSATRF